MNQSIVKNSSWWHFLSFDQRTCGWLCRDEKKVHQQQVPSIMIHFSQKLISSYPLPSFLCRIIPHMVWKTKVLFLIYLYSANHIYSTQKKIHHDCATNTKHLFTLSNQETFNIFTFHSNQNKFSTTFKILHCWLGCCLPWNFFNGILLSRY